MNVVTVIAAGLCLFLPLSLAFAGRTVTGALNKLSLRARVSLASCLAIPYLLVSTQYGVFQIRWLVIYALLPTLVAVALWRAHERDPEQLGHWLDFAVLLILGFVVEFRRFEPAWPTHLGAFNRIILFDAGLYGFMVVRQFSHVGFDLRPRLSDWRNGIRELVLYAPIAVSLGLSLGFLHLHTEWPGIARVVGSFVSIFFLIAILEETYFRGWWQNLLERRCGPNGALLATSVLFGLSHFNKDTTVFNWRYVFLATLAGIFYGRAWRSEHRIFASALTHACVDTIWLLWLR